METKFHVTLEKISKIADKIGSFLHIKSKSLGFSLTFIVIIVFFGTLTFISQFVFSLLGKNRND